MLSANGCSVRRYCVTVGDGETSESQSPEAWSFVSVSLYTTALFFGRTTWGHCLAVFY